MYRILHQEAVHHHHRSQIFFIYVVNFLLHFQFHLGLS